MSTNLSMTPVASVPITGQQTKYVVKNVGEKTFRFIHIPSLIKENTIAIFATTEIPRDTYACISYPWGGLPAVKGDAVIVVEGLALQDAVSISMLKMVSVAANKLGIEYLWLDKLCIRQDEGGASDLTFQKGHMYDVYASCKTCFVTPAGMFQLPKIDENTTWIDRAWTLQEALAPRDVRVLFSWVHGRKSLQHTGFTIVDEATEGVGMAPLRGLLECGLKNEVQILDADADADADERNEPVITCNVKIMTGRIPSEFAMKALLGAIDHTEDDGRLNAIWRCLIMRSASYKEDLIFGSTGVMGVNVTGDGIKEGGKYDDNQVTQLLIRYIKAIAAKYQRAEWLGIAPSLGTARDYSGLPTLPLAKNLGRGFIKEDGRDDRIIPHPDVIEDGWWSLSGSPRVSVEDNGDITFTAQAFPAQESKDQPLAESPVYESEYPNNLINRSTNRLWNLVPDTTDSKSFAIIVGSRVPYLNGNFPMINYSHTALLMLVTELEPGRYRNEGYAWAEPDLTNGWKETLFRVGG